MFVLDHGGSVWFRKFNRSSSSDGRTLKEIKQAHRRSNKFVRLDGKEVR